MKTLNQKKPQLVSGLTQALAGVLFCTLVSTTDAQTLTHRWSFDDANDSVGTAAVSLVGEATIGGGVLNVPGGANAAAYGSVDISSDFTNYISTTIECWFTEAVIQDWSKAWMFGNGGNNADAGTTYIDFTPNRGSAQAPGISITPSPFAGGDIAYAGPSQLPAGVQHHAVAVYNYSANTITLYINGKYNCSGSMQNTPISALACTQYRFGAGTSWPDSSLNGTFDEMRVYDGPLTPAQAEANYEAGPGSISGVPGTLASIEFNNAANVVIGGQFTPSILGNYTLLTNTVNITTEPGITYSSDDTNVVSYGTDGKFHANALGSTTIRASYESQEATLLVTVSLEPAEIVHRYSFDGAAGTTTITDSVGGANGTLMWGTDTATLNGSGQLILDGNFSAAFVELPDGIISALTNATFQTWVNNQDAFAPDWAELWAFGTNNGVQGIEYITLIPNNPNNSRLRFDFHGSGGASIDAPSSLALSNDVCVTVTYNYSAQFASIYVDGRKVATGTMTKALYTLPDSDNYIGQSQWYGSGDPYFTGVLDEFRIFSGVESDLQIAIDAAAGPDTFVTDPGALLSLTVVAPTNVDIHGVSVPVQVLANFENISGVDVSTMPETSITSSDPMVGTIENGNFAPINVGASTVAASYGGTSGMVDIQVVDTSAWPTLLHRYTFNETSGTTLHDSVGSIDGTINGPVTLTGSEMIMPDGNPAPGEDGLPTASSGWVAFPAGMSMVSGLPDQASIECWVTWAGGAVWQEMFDFGQAATPGISLGGGTYVMVSPHDGATGALRLEWFPGGLTLLGPSLVQGELSQVVITHDQSRQLDKLYRNGELIATGSNDRLWSSLPDTDNWLARDQWRDAMFNGSYSDMRIWNGALTAGQVADLYTAGPDVIPGPALQITKAGSQAVIQWPANATTFGLESTADLVNGTWGTVGGTPVVTNGVNNLVVPTSQEQTYYRLKQ